MSKPITFEPFQFIGQPDTWGPFGTDPNDAASDAERRALLDHFLRRHHKLVKRGSAPDDAWCTIAGSSFVAIANLFISMAGGTAGLDNTSFDKFLSCATFAWMQSVGADQPETGSA